MAQQCHVGRRTVGRILHNETQSNGKVRGRPKKLSKRTRRLIRRHVEAEVRAGRRVTSLSIKEKLHLEFVSRETIQRTVKQDEILYRIAKKKLPLTAVQRQKRVNFARRHLLSGTDFSRWIFSDEKRFSLDGPDNFGSYGTDNVELSRIKRHMGGGGVMVLDAISSKGHLLIKVCFCDVKM